MIVKPRHNVILLTPTIHDWVRETKLVLMSVSRKVIAVEMEEGEGARVRRVFPTSHLMHLDPFVLLDEFFVEPPAGFPSHPHGGFEAVTYMLEGGFHHTDNLGNDSVVLAGGVQRFTAGRRIVHSELPGTNGLNRGLQLWVRLPNRLMGLEPDYQQVEPLAIPEKDVDGCRVRMIVGEESPVRLRTDIEYLDVTLPQQKEFMRAADPSFNAILYVLEGALTVSKSRVERGEAAVLTAGNQVKVHSTEKARLVLISGRPHSEPITLRGSFVH